MTAKPPAKSSAPSRGKTPETPPAMDAGMALALEGLGIGIALFDADDRLIMANRAFATLQTLPDLDLSPGRAYQDILDDSLAQGIFADNPMAKAMLSDIAKHGDGKPLDLLLANQNHWLRHEDRRTERGRTALRQDVSEWKRLSIRLNDSENRYRLLADTSLNGLLIHYDGVIQEANAAASQLFDTPVASIIGRAPAELVATIDQPRLEESIARDTGNVVEITCLQPNGTPFLAEARTRRIPSREGLAGVIAIRDVTERLRVQETLRRREAILSAVGLAAETFLADEDWHDSLPRVLEQLGTAAGVSHVFLHQLRNTNQHNPDHAGADTNPAPVIHSGNYQVEKQWSWTAQGYDDPLFQDQLEAFDPVSSGLAELVDLRRGSPAIASLDEADEERRELMEYAGIQSFCLFPVRPFEEWGDPLWGVIGFLQLDQSREWLDIEVETLGTAVNLIVAALRRDQASGQLRDAKDMAERASSAKSEFLAVISHEIRTPMNAILGMLGLLSSTEMSVEQQDFTDTAREAANGLMTIIEDILDVSRMEAGRLVLDNRDFDLVEQVEAIVEIFIPRVHEQNLRLSADIPFDLPRKLRGDAGRLRQILLNLLGNAIKFTSDGSISLSISVEANDDEPASEVGADKNPVTMMDREPPITLRFAVEDTGIGISQEGQEALFADFYQASHSLNRHHGGAGLGLSICRRLVDLLGGRIGVESKLGRGSVFWFTIPLREANPDDPRKIIGTSGQSRWLLVAQNSLICASLDRQLQDANIQLDRVDDLEALPEDLRGYQQLMFDADIYAPELPRLSQSIKQAQIPTTLLDHSPFGQDRQRHQAGGFDHVLPIPFRRQEIRALVEGQPIPNRRSSNGSNSVATGNVRTKTDQTPMALIVDDSMTMQTSMATALEGLGYRTSAASQAKPAIELLDQQTVDLIIVDLTHEAVDAAGLLERMKRLPGLDQVSRIGLIDPDNPPPASTMTMITASLPRDAELDQLKQLIRQTSPHHLGADSDADGRSPDQADDPTMELRDSPSIDRKTIDDLRESVGDDIIGDLIDSFDTEARDRSKKLVDALMTKDLVGIGDEAHALKSLAGSFGAPRLMNLAGELETASKEAREAGDNGDDHPVLARTSADRVRDEVDQVILALRSIPILERVKG
ncbi:MAG: ATP-binding protein [Pseudomonadota bacterium]